jgi:hypothetical protein
MITRQRLVVLLLSVALVGVGPAGMAAPSGVEAVPEPRTHFLDSVSLTSAVDGWAVGSSDGTESRPGNQARHWDGEQWTSVKTPKVGTYGFISGVDALAPDNAYAVGRGKNGGALVEHWNGTKWSITATTPFNTFLLSVSAASANDIWAVGWNYGTISEVLLHFDGSSWATVQGASRSTGGLTDVEARTGTNVWASGFLQGQTRPLVERYDGSAWRLADGIAELPANSRANAVTSLRANDTWLAGSYTSGDATIPMLAHWNGSHWKLAKLPIDEGVLRDVYAIAKNDVWAVGVAGGKSLALHYDGTAWTAVATPSPGAEASLSGLDGISSDEVAAVGGYVTPTGARKPLTLRWDGVSWQRT